MLYHFVMKNLQSLMKDAKESSYDLARMLGISHSAAYYYMSGKTEPNIEKLVKIADHYGVTVDYLIDHQSNASLPLGVLSKDQQAVVAAIKNLSDEECRRLISYIDGMQGKEFKPVRWEDV